MRTTHFRIKMRRAHQAVLVTGFDEEGYLKNLVDLPEGAEYEVDIINEHEHDDGTAEQDDAHCVPMDTVDLQFEDGGIWHNAATDLFDVIT